MDVRTILRTGAWRSSTTSLGLVSALLGLHRQGFVHTDRLDGRLGKEF